MVQLTTLMTVLGSAAYLKSKQHALTSSQILVPWHDDGDAVLYSATTRTLPQFPSALYYTETNKLGHFGPDDYFHFWYLHFKRTDDVLFRHALDDAFLTDVMASVGAAGMWVGESDGEKRAWLIILAVQEPPIIGGHLRDAAPQTMLDFIDRSRHSVSGFFAHVYVTEEMANAARRNAAPAAPKA